MNKGWRNESYRHALAAKGIKTKQTKLEDYTVVKKPDVEKKPVVKKQDIPETKNKKKKKNSSIRELLLSGGAPKNLDPQLLDVYKSNDVWKEREGWTPRVYGQAVYDEDGNRKEDIIYTKMSGDAYEATKLVDAGSGEEGHVGPITAYDKETGKFFVRSEPTKRAIDYAKPRDILVTVVDKDGKKKKKTVRFGTDEFGNLIPLGGHLQSRYLKDEDTGIEYVMWDGADGEKIYYRTPKETMKRKVYTHRDEKTGKIKSKVMYIGDQRVELRRSGVSKPPKLTKNMIEFYQHQNEIEEKNRMIEEEVSKEIKRQKKLRKEQRKIDKRMMRNSR